MTLLAFQPRGEGLRETTLMARMQKAIAVIQFKLEAQVIARHPEYHMQHRALITAIDLERGTVPRGQGVPAHRHLAADARPA